MSDLRGIKVGDTIWVVRRGDGHNETVERVGRLWVHTTRHSAYHIDSGKKQYDDWCVAYRSQEELDAIQREYVRIVIARKRLLQLIESYSTRPTKQFIDELLELLDKHYPEEDRT